MVALQEAGYAIAENYLVEYSVHSSGTWTTFSHTASYGTTITVTGLTASTNYDFRVSAISWDGTVGAASALANQTTSAAATFAAIDNFLVSTTNTSAATSVIIIYAANIQHVPPGTVTQFKVGIQGPVNRVFMGYSTGTQPNATSLTQVFFGGNPGLSQSTSSQTLSDAVTLSTWDKVTDLVISLETTAGMTYCYSNAGDETSNGSRCEGWTNLLSGKALEANLATKTDQQDFGAGISTGVYTVQTNGG